jgi:hypothetical protein
MRHRLVQRLLRSAMSSPGAVPAAMLVLCGCAGVRVVVEDPAGRPVAGATVEGVTPSYGVPAVRTDARGEARVPATIQDLEWVRVRGDGYCPSFPDVVVRGQPQPVHVVLHPLGEAACPGSLDLTPAAPPPPRAGTPPG